MVSGSIGSLKLAVISELMATPVAFTSGVVELTEGAVRSGATPVVNCQLKAAAIGLFATSVTLGAIVALHVVLAGSALAGVKVAMSPFTAYPTVPVIGAPAGHASVK